MGYAIVNVATKLNCLMQQDASMQLLKDAQAAELSGNLESAADPVSYTHLTLPTTPYV